MIPTVFTRLRDLAILGAVPEAMSLKVEGMADGRAVTLDLDGDTLMWRMAKTRRAPAENIVTTLHQVRDVRWIEARWSVPALGLIVAGGVLALFGLLRHAIIAWGVGAALSLISVLRPRRMLLLDLGSRALALSVTPTTAPAARAIAARIRGILASGETPDAPPMLP